MNGPEGVCVCVCGVCVYVGCVWVCFSDKPFSIKDTDCRQNSFCSNARHFEWTQVVLWTYTILDDTSRLIRIHKSCIMVITHK